MDVNGINPWILFASINNFLPIILIIQPNTEFGGECGSAGAGNCASANLWIDAKANTGSGRIL